jgi:hypothetical protein
MTILVQEKGRHMILFRSALVAAALLAASSAGAVTVDLSLSEPNRFSGPGFYQLTKAFELPTGYTNAQISITSFSVDDRGVALLNGAIVDNTGIFGPGSGLLKLTADGTDNPFTYTRGNGDRSLVLTSGFLTGANSFSIVVNDTNNGINGNTLATAAQTNASITATLTYDVVAGVPEPATWATILLGFGLVGAAVRRRPLAALA